MSFDLEQRKIVKEVLCPGISDAQLDLFAQVCARTGLDPFSRQIYATLRKANDGTKERPVWVNKLTIQTGIDGLRLIAERSEKYEGQAPFEWCGKDGKWTDVWLSDQPPSAARAKVYKTGFRDPLTRVARWRAYNQENHMWRKMDAEQLAKCAEALSLRTAFPQELSGLYTNDEIEAPQLPASTTAPTTRSLAENVVDEPQEPAAEPESPPPLPTCLAKNYPVKGVAGMPFASCPTTEIAKYVTYYEAKLPTTTQDNHRQAIARTLLAAQAEIERRIDLETGEFHEPPTEGVGVDDDFRSEDPSMDGQRESDAQSVD